jgi:Big-like domain-containing protein
MHRWHRVSLLGLSLVLAARIASADSLTISPSRVVLPLGGAQRLELRDSSGASVSGAEWSLSAPDVVSLSTSPIVTVAAVAAGEVTITATAGGESAEATVTVLPASEVPADTPMWTVPRVTPDDGVPPTLVRAQNDDGTGADYFLVEGLGSAPLVRGVRLDGTEVWRRQLSAGVYVSNWLADENGGVVFQTYDPAVDPNGCALVRLNGQSGTQTWQLPRNGCFRKPALLPSGTLVTAVGEGYSEVQVLGVNPGSGQVLFDAPTGHSDYCGWLDPDGLSDFTVGSDGVAYALRTHIILAGDCLGYGVATYEQWLDLVAVQPNGTLVVVEPLHESHNVTTENFEVIGAGQVFPSPGGGVVATWYKAVPGQTARQFVTTVHDGRVDVELDSTVEAVGSDGSGYGHRQADGVITSSDTITGALRAVSAEAGQILAVLSDQSVVAQGASGGLVRIDNSGQSTALSGFASVAGAALDSVDQVVMLAGGDVVAVPGAGAELDPLFPLQDGNPRRQRRRSDPALTVSRATVTRGGTVTFRLSGVLPSEVVGWRFVPDDSSIGEVIRSTTVHSLSWLGQIVTPGTVTATVVRDAVPRELSRHIDVAPRPNFSRTVSPPPAELKPHGFEPPGSPYGPMVLPRPPQPGGRQGQYYASLPYTFDRGALIAEHGPNHGYRSVANLQIGAGSLQPIYVYVVVPDVEPGEEFYQRQCGTWSEANPAGFIAGSTLRQNIYQHEGGAVGRSHYTQFVDALADPSNDLGNAIEAIVIGGGVSIEVYDEMVNNAMSGSVLARIHNATGAEPCPNTAYDGSSGVCVYKGSMNYPPYQPCQ